MSSPQELGIASGGVYEYSKRKTLDIPKMYLKRISTFGRFSQNKVSRMYDKTYFLKIVCDKIK